jgi:WD40 repeat protein
LDDGTAERRPNLHCFELSPDGTQALWSGLQGVAIYDLLTGAEVGVPVSLPRERPAFARFAWSADGKRIAAVSDRDGVIYVFAENGRTLARLVGHRGAVLSIRFDAKGERLVSASADGTARVWALPPVAKPAR